MTSLDLQADLERWINFNESAGEPIDFREIILDYEIEGITEVSIRRKLKEMGYIIDDYGCLTKVRM